MIFLGFFLKQTDPINYFNRTFLFFAVRSSLAISDAINGLRELIESF